MKQQMPYGFWHSPITEELLTSDVKSFSDLVIDPITKCVYWRETRPSENGRSTIMKFDGEKSTELLDSNYSAKSKVHEYGGGSFCVYNENLFFINSEDQNIYYEFKGKTKLFYGAKHLRFAQPIVSPKHKKLISICEDHSNPHEIINTIVWIDLENQKLQTIASGYDFYIDLCLDPNEENLAFICWDRPNMQWDESYLYEIHLHDLSMTKLYEQSHNSVSQPKYSNSGQLYFITEETGYWNLATIFDGRASLVTNNEAEHGAARWIINENRFCFLQNQIISICTDKGEDTLQSISLASHEQNPINTPFSSIQTIAATDDKIYLIGSNPHTSNEIVCLDVQHLHIDIIAHSFQSLVDSQDLSSPEIKTFQKGDEKIYGIYYPPHSTEYEGLDKTLPPLIIKVHGGPTTHVSMTFDLVAQYFTSRGFGYLLVNYRGSTGYGKCYREKLCSNWGELEVEDCALAARQMIQEKLVNPEYIFIRGSSAGGLTVLNSLCSQDLYKAGCSYYGVTDLELLLQDTHKFEAGYLDSLIGKYPEKKKRYEQRSPLKHIESLNKPICIFQGLEDQVVPKKHAFTLVEQLKKANIPFHFQAFDHEGHGFRKPSTIQICLKEELEFYLSLFSDKIVD